MDADQRRRQRDRLAAPADLDAARMPGIRARQVVDHDRGAARPSHVAELLRPLELEAADVDPPELTPARQIAELGLGEDAHTAISSASSSSISSAARFSRRCSIDSVPGIGSITAERCSSQASLTAFSDTPRRVAAAVTPGPPAPRSGKYGTNGMPSRS